MTTKQPEHVIALAKRLYQAHAGTDGHVPWTLDELARWCAVAIASIDERRTSSSRYAMQLVREWEANDAKAEDVMHAVRTADAMAIELENLAALATVWKRRARRHGCNVEIEHECDAPIGESSSRFVNHDG